MEQVQQKEQPCQPHERHQQETRQPRRFPYFLGGAALGAALGFLFAPKPGKETREDLNEWLKEKREQWKNRPAAKKETIGLRGDSNREPVGARR